MQCPACYAVHHQPLTCLSDQRVTINVSGQRFQISSQLLDVHPDTLLGSDEKEYFYVKHSGEYVFDRDPQLFRLIIIYYQTGRLHYPRHQCVCVACGTVSVFFVLCCMQVQLPRFTKHVTIKLHPTLSKGRHESTV